MPTKPNILIVDDRAQNLFALETQLRKLEVNVHQAASGLEALTLTLEHEFALAIVDVQMPEMNGYELVELIRSNDSTKNLPVIFMSAVYGDNLSYMKGYQAGAVDFLSKPFIPEILLSKVQVFLDLYKQRLQLQDLVSQLNNRNELLQDEILHRREAEIALQAANEELANLNQDKDKFFSIVAHDLKGPFLPLLGNLELMIEMAENLTPKDSREMSMASYRSARRVYEFLENLLEWARLQMGRMEYQPEPLNLAQLATKTINLLQANADAKGIEVQNNIDTSLIVLADENMLDVIIRNLTNNALKFTTMGGRVTLTAQAQNDLVEIAVIDTGVGMSEEVRQKLFRLDHHVTTVGTGQEKGTGLGLIMCQEMVLKHGGRIWAESILGQGTTIKFTIRAKN